ncbi:hypothetical protein B0H13DRAFT_1917100 [Mycena leptocephala]|nr:hypothetical protein B0H13DRAFT_1917100 [Mycena leptocephala]
MPRQNTSTAADTRMSNITAYLTPALTLLDELNDAFGSSFLQPILKTTLSLITAAQNVKRNRDDCLWLMENIHLVIYAIVNLHMKSETPGSLHPSVLDHIGKFTETLHKIHTFVEAQQDGSKIKYLFRQGEMNTLLKACHTGLDTALEVFKIEIGTMVFDGIDEMKQKMENMHRKLLQLISTLSGGTLSDTSSLVYQGSNPSQNR